MHKDINTYYLDNSKVIYTTIKELEMKNILKKLDENDYFTLYELNQNYLVPLIWSDKNYLYFQKNNPVKYNLNINIKEKTKIEFHQAYNSQWKLYLEPNPDNSWCKPIEYYKNTRTTECEHAQKTFDAGDLTYLLAKPVFEDTHTMVEGYANSWTIDPEYIKANYPKEFYKESRDGSIELGMVLYFKPQSYFYIGLIISGLAFIWSMIYIVRDMRRR
ncbi:Uncharacterised protein [uncultured archaeon]|nr:Uncharacterised protein [uncultured archaeon]